MKKYERGLQEFEEINISRKSCRGVGGKLLDFCLDFVQKFGLRRIYRMYVQDVWDKVTKVRDFKTIKSNKKRMDV